ncbi:hypothetical protein FE257_001475 [Aspergillus nanangensis]|uniref:Uncharacterized protein n=1 Tax=Aspergillus nanangensis TaxID=2582783 RepID=A0AAD4GPK0_ASPNN|nr:hypothetical protein FE257_001475 [Aspergillus nanangensis]
MAHRILRPYFLLLTLFVQHVLSVSYEKIYQFDSGEFIENIAARSNGHLLLSVLTEPNLYTLDPSVPNAKAQIIHHFDGSTGVTGIAEIAHDIFAVSAGQLDLRTFQGVKGTFAVYTVDLTASAPVINKLADIPDTTNLNGIALSPFSPNVLLLSDSASGAIWSLDIKTGSSRIVLQDPLFEARPSNPLGINGLKTRGKYVYFTNSAQGIFGRVPFSVLSTASGPAQIITKVPGAGFDDFTFDLIGNALIANHPGSLYQISASGVNTVLINSTSIVEPTSAIFGRGSNESAKTLYVTTGGQFTVPGGTGGQLFAVTLF